MKYSKPSTTSKDDQHCSNINPFHPIARMEKCIKICHTPGCGRAITHSFHMSRFCDACREGALEHVGTMVPGCRFSDEPSPTFALRPAFMFNRQSQSQQIPHSHQPEFWAYRHPDDRPTGDSSPDFGSLQSPELTLPPAREWEGAPWQSDQRRGSNPFQQPVGISTGHVSHPPQQAQQRQCPGVNFGSDPYQQNIGTSTGHVSHPPREAQQRQFPGVDFGITDPQYLMNPLSNPRQQAKQRQFPSVDFGNDPNFSNTHYQGRQYSKDRAGNLPNVPLAEKVRVPYGPHAMAREHSSESRRNSIPQPGHGLSQQQMFPDLGTPGCGTQYLRQPIFPSGRPDEYRERESFGLPRYDLPVRPYCYDRPDTTRESEFAPPVKPKFPTVSYQQHSGQDPIREPSVLAPMNHPDPAIRQWHNPWDGADQYEVQPRTTQPPVPQDLGWRNHFTRPYVDPISGQPGEYGQQPRTAIDLPADQYGNMPRNLPPQPPSSLQPVFPPQTIQSSGWGYSARQASTTSLGRYAPVVGQTTTSTSAVSKYRRKRSKEERGGLSRKAAKGLPHLILRSKTLDEDTKAVMCMKCVRSARNHFAAVCEHPTGTEGSWAGHRDMPCASCTTRAMGHREHECGFEQQLSFGYHGKEA